MIFFRGCIGILYILASCCFSQTTVSGRFVGLGVFDLDSASVLIKEGTGDTTYARAWASKDGSFRAKTNHMGTLMAEFTCPRFKTLQAALICDTPASLKVDVTLARSSDTSGAGTLVIHDSLSLLAKYTRLHLESDRRWARIAEERRQRASEGKDPDSSAIDWSVDIRSIEKELSRETEPLLRQELIMQYNVLNGYNGSKVSADSLAKWIPEIPPTSSAWVYHSNLAWVSGLMFHRDGLRYVDNIVANHANVYFRARMLYELARWARAQEDYRRVDSLIATLADGYSATNWAAKARLLLPVLHVGDPVPRFTLRSIDDSSSVSTEKSMLGRVYLIDFWATWCTPCVGEMPYLHRAYERFRAHGFTILSVSDDSSVEAIAMFRKRRYGMPWFHALESSESSIRWAFGVWGIPFPVLVNTQGIIVALGDDLIGENLDKTLEKLVGK